jgi:predicted amidophosphoribosyltransferase
MPCLGCKKAAKDYICELCESEFQSLLCEETYAIKTALAPDLQVRALYQYKGIVRDTILRAKVANDALALALILKLFLQSRSVNEVVGNAKSLIAMPSSLWGRLRGRFNIAEALVIEMGPIFDIPIFELPLSTYFRYGKNAMKSREERGNFVVKLAGDSKEKMNSLLIDDIITSGLSLSRICSHLAPQTQAIVFASAVT